MTFARPRSCWRRFDDSMRPVEDALTLPPVVYTSEEFLDFERRALFDREWLCVGRASRIPEPGDFFTVRPNGEGVIVARDKDGAIHAFSSVCRHRGHGGGGGRRQRAPRSPARTTTGSTASTGACSAHPAMERTHDFDKKDWGLPQPRRRGLAGFRLRQPGPGRRRRSPRRWTRYEPFLEHYHLEDCVCPGTFTLTDLPWNWKVMFENFNDGYHANRLHQVIQDFCPSDLPRSPCRGTTTSNVVFRTQRLHPHRRWVQRHHEGPAADLPRAHGGGALALDVRAHPADAVLRHRARPGFFFIVTPKSAGTIDVEIGYLVAPDRARAPDVRPPARRCPTPACRCSSARTRTPRRRSSGGMSSRFAVRGRYSWQEESHVQFNRWLVPALPDGTTPSARRTRSTISNRPTEGENNEKEDPNNDGQVASPAWPR